MFKPEEQQVEICLLKSNLEELENDLVLQRSALPALDAENEQKYRETMAALRTTRALNTEIERLKLENVRLTAKRMQLKRQSDDLMKNVEQARANQTEMTKLKHTEETEIERQIRGYEDNLREISDRFRKTRGYYNEEQINAETEKVNTIITELEDELDKRQSMVNELKQQIAAIHPDLPENLLIILGKEDMDAKINDLETKRRTLIEKHNLLVNKKNYIM